MFREKAYHSDKKIRGEEDGVVTNEINIDKNSIDQEIFPNAFKNKLKILYNKDWKKITE